MESVYEEKRNCCGCNSCLKICPVNSITMQEDEYGFLYPSIDELTCISCGRCVDICPMTNVVGNKVDATYAVRLNDTAIRNSASGGAAYALAKSFLDNKGIVFGCAFDDDFQAVHIEVNSAEELYRLQGSKYVQSDMSCHIRIKELLSEGKCVLFIGTPCQVASIKTFVGKKYIKQLTTIEFVCHGVPSASFWNSYKSYLENKHCGKLTSFSFRAKDQKSTFVEKYSIQSKNRTKEYFVPSVLSYYYDSFLRGKTYRASCYFCPFASEERQADITICDYWGYNGIIFKDLLDVSAVMISSFKGNELFQSALDYFHVEKSHYSLVSVNNEQLNRPSSIEKYDESFLQLWKLRGAEAVARYHMKKHYKAYVLNAFGLL